MGKKARARRHLRRIMTQKRREWIDRKRRIDEHHLIPKSRKGPRAEWNILRIKRFRHEAWHFLFDLPGGRPRTLDEIIELLLRLKRAKARLRKPH